MEQTGPTSFRSIADEPWLTLPFRPQSGGWMRIRYRAGLLQDPVRPLLRMRDAEGRDRFEIMAGPVCGGASWVWRVPPDTVSLAISPVAEPGAFSFAVDELVTIGRARLLAGALRRKPPLAMRALGLWIAGKRVRARHFVQSIWASTPMNQYAAWRRARCADPLPSAADATWSEPLTVLIDMRQGSDDDGERSRRSLSDLGVKAELFRGEPTLVETGWVAALEAGDTLDPGAMPAFAAQLARDPSLHVLYSDGDTRKSAGRPAESRLEPGWSPRFETERTQRGGFLLARTSARVIRAEPGQPLWKTLLDPLPTPGEVAHVRRILLHRSADGPSPAAPSAPPSESTAVLAKPAVSVVIPTRDRLDLLRACIEGLRKRTRYDDFEIVIVDNGSEDAETLAFFVSLAQAGGVRVLSRPGPFNFSRLCNEGVAAARGTVVVLLNNDVEATEPGWLDRMVAEAVRAEVGAVGARLLYPDGRLQHGGVIVGLGGAAGHIGRGQPGDATGWLGRLASTHEISAVTGACLAVSRGKYLQVGGLDEDDLPVSFNDIDFCLKLRRAGYTNLMVPAATLIHHESATRGSDRDGAKQARAEREAAIFAERWRAVMRDDPYYHPGLSLLRFNTSLG